MDIQAVRACVTLPVGYLLLSHERVKEEEVPSFLHCPEVSHSITVGCGKTSQKLLNHCQSMKKHVLLLPKMCLTVYLLRLEDLIFDR